MPVSLSVTAILLLLVLAPPQPATPGSADWPGLWGPSRNGVASGTLTAAPSRTEVLWRRPTQGGYSEIVVQGGRLFTMELRGGDDFVIAMDAATGRDLWSVRVGPTYRGHGGSDDGPIATPSVEGNDLFALGPHGQLLAIDVASGKERWRKDLPKEFGAAAPTWGFAASPLIEGRLAIVPTAGEKSRGLLAFDRASGRLVWNTPGATHPSYASAVATTIGGVRQIIAASTNHVAGVSPADGRILWTAKGPEGDVANSPLVLPGGRVLLSRWEDSLMLEVSARNGTFSASEVWRSPRLRSSNGPTIYRDGYLYGFVAAQLVCIDSETGEVRWRERTGPGTLIAAGDRLIVLGQESGELQIIRAAPDAFSAIYKTAVLEPGARAVTGPSFAGGRIFVRNLKEIVALRLN